MPHLIERASERGSESEREREIERKRERETERTRERERARARERDRESVRERAREWISVVHSNLWCARDHTLMCPTCSQRTCQLMTITHIMCRSDVSFNP